MSSFQKDLNKEQILGIYLDRIYSELNISLIRNQDIDLQHKGVDLTFHHNGNVFYIDEKAQLDYINSDLPTFTFELSYLKNKLSKIGWLIDSNKITTHYFLITGIYAKDIKDLSKGFYKCNIISVNKKRLINHLESIGLSKDKLNGYQINIRQRKEEDKKIFISELNKNQGCIYYSYHLSEKPINLQLHLKYLLKLKIAKKIYPMV